MKNTILFGCLLTVLQLQAANNENSLLNQIISQKNEWSVESKKGSCSEGLFIKLIEPSDSYLLGSNISFFNVNLGEKITEELSHPDCTIYSNTTYKNEILESKTEKKCKNSKNRKIISYEKLELKSTEELIYKTSTEHCVYKVKK